jgi:hypothetical protein
LSSLFEVSATKSRSHDGQDLKLPAVLFGGIYNAASGLGISAISSASKDGCLLGTGESAESRFRHPQLPCFMDTIEIRDLTIMGTSLDLRLQRYPNNVGINVVRKSGKAEAVIIA